MKEKTVFGLKWFLQLRLDRSYDGIRVWLSCLLFVETGTVFMVVNWDKALTGRRHQAA